MSKKLMHPNVFLVTTPEARLRSEGFASVMVESGSSVVTAVAGHSTTDTAVRHMEYDVLYGLSVQGGECFPDDFHAMVRRIGKPFCMMTLAPKREVIE